MGFVQKAVARLDEPEKLLPLITELGCKHSQYGVNPAYVDVSMCVWVLQPCAGVSVCVECYSSINSLIFASYSYLLNNWQGLHWQILHECVRVAILGLMFFIWTWIYDASKFYPMLWGVIREKISQSYFTYAGFNNMNANKILSMDEFSM